MNAAKKRKLEKSLKALEKEGLVFRGLTDYEAQRRTAIRQLKSQIKRYDRATTVFFKWHFNEKTRRWDSDNSKEFFGHIRKTRDTKYANLTILNGQGDVPHEWDSDG